MTKMQPNNTDKSKNDFELWTLLDNARFAIARLRGIELAQYGLTPEQTAILRTIYESHRPLTTKELMDVTMRQPNSISIIVNRMIKSGLIKRRKNRSGKRIYKYSLTKNGEDIIKKVRISSIEMPFASLNLEEKQQLFTYLNVLLKSALRLLGIPHQSPFIKYLEQNKHHY